MVSYLSSWYLEGLHVPEYEQSFSQGVSGLFLVFINAFQKNGVLRFEQEELVFEKEDFLVFLVNVHDCKAF